MSGRMRNVVEQSTELLQIDMHKKLSSSTHKIGLRRGEVADFTIHLKPVGVFLPITLLPLVKLVGLAFVHSLLKYHFSVGIPRQLYNKGALA